MNKGIIYDIQRLSIHDGPGIRTVVFFKGCPMSCKWCANPESQNPNPEMLWFENLCIYCNKCVAVCPNRPEPLDCLDVRKHKAECSGCGKCVEVCIPRAKKLTGMAYTADEIVDEIKQDIHFYKRSGGGVTFSGGEPFMQSGILLEVMERVKRINIHTAIETSGFTAYENIHKASRYLDTIFYDLKHMDSEKHKTFTGVRNEVILENLKNLAGETRIRELKNITVRVPLISGINDSDENIIATAEFISQLDAVCQIEFLCYHKLGIPKYGQLRRVYELKEAKMPDIERLKEIDDLLSRHLRNDIVVKITE